MAGLTNHVSVAASAPVDLMATNATQTTTYGTVATSATISVTAATPALVECAPLSSSAHDDGDVVTSNLTATRVTDPHGAVTVIN
jgi:hypothetical protein